MREWSSRLLLIAISTVVAVATGELVLRGLEPLEDSDAYLAFRISSEPGLDFEFVPNVRIPWAGREIRTNSMGFRGKEFSLEPETEPRIAIIGDSICAGYGVAENEALPGRLETLVHEQDLTGEVLSLCVAGYNISQIIGNWRAKASRFRPAVVVYAMCLNDAMPELHLSSEGTLVAAGAIDLDPERSQPGRIPLPGKDWLRENSAFYRLAMNGYDLALRSFGFRAEPLPPLARIERLYVGSREADAFEARLAELVGLVDGTEARFVLMVFPLEDQVRARRALPQLRLAAVARELGIEYLDLFPVFLKATEPHHPATLFDPDGLHPNPMGHELAATALLELLRPGWGGKGRHATPD